VTQPAPPGRAGPLWAAGPPWPLAVSGWTRGRCQAKYIPRFASAPRYRIGLGDLAAHLFLRAIRYSAIRPVVRRPADEGGGHLSAHIATAGPCRRSASAGTQVPPAGHATVGPLWGSVGATSDGPTRGRLGIGIGTAGRKRRVIDSAGGRRFALCTSVRHSRRVQLGTEC
jgi:hypothetical protein